MVDNRAYILLYRGKSWVSKLIRWQTRSVYSHASLYFPGIGNIEAWHKDGVRLKEHYCDGHIHGTVIDVFEVNITKEQVNKIFEFVYDKVGKDYDFRSVFRFLTRQPEDQRDKNKWFCSELVFASFQEAGINLLKRIDPWQVSPALLSFSPKLIKVNTFIC